MAKTSIEKSHSKVSNFKLTLICLFLSLIVGLIFVGLIIFKSFQTYSIIFLTSGPILTFLMLLLLNKFSR